MIKPPPRERLALTIMHGTSRVSLIFTGGRGGGGVAAAPIVEAERVQTLGVDASVKPLREQHVQRIAALDLAQPGEEALLRWVGFRQRRLVALAVELAVFGHLIEFSIRLLLDGGGGSGVLRGAAGLLFGRGFGGGLGRGLSSGGAGEGVALRRPWVVVLGGVGDDQHIRVGSAPLHLLPRRTSLRTATPIVTPTFNSTLKH